SCAQCQRCEFIEESHAPWCGPPIPNCPRVRPPQGVFEFMATPRIRQAALAVRVGQAACLLRKGALVSLHSEPTRAGTRRAFALRALTGALFLLVFLLPTLADLPKSFWYTDYVGSRVMRWVEPSVPHFEFHTLAPTVSLTLTTLILAVGLVLGPYQRGDPWAWWTLALAGLGFIAGRAGGPLALYPQCPEEVLAPFRVWLVASGLSWRSSQDRHTWKSGGEGSG